MPVRFENFTHSFTIKGKPVFVPTSLGRKIGNDVKGQVTRQYNFPYFYFHLRSGGHVAALHAHRENRYFAYADISNFFYSIGRNRVTRCLRNISVDRPNHYSKWSCVRNPFDNPRYSLPYGFIQSPMLASLVLSCSPLGGFLHRIKDEISVCVYMDDISISSNNSGFLERIYAEMIGFFYESNFDISKEKFSPPAENIVIFNCNLSYGHSSVSQQRKDIFLSENRSSLSEDAFNRYCDYIEQGNIP